MIVFTTRNNISKILFLALSLSSTTFAANNGRRPLPWGTSKVSRYDNSTGGGSGDVIVRDVVVLGGGATGTFAALKLKDANKTVVVVEQKDRLGGHTETYHDPVTGKTDDCGVEQYENLAIVNETFARYNISLVLDNVASSPFTPLYADFTTGKPINVSTTLAGEEAEALALQQYYEILATNYSYLNDGFDLPDPVPSDLLITFQEFVAKYSLEAAVPIFTSFAQGVGNILNLPMLYVFKYIRTGLISDISTGFLTTAQSDNSLLYEAATAELGENALLSTQVLSIDRSNPEHISLVISTPTGTKTILAKQLISTIPPILSNLEFFDLDNEEKEVFGQFSGKGYYTALIRNIGLSNSLLLTNINPSTPYNVAPVPSIYVIESSFTIPNITHVYYGSESILNSSQVQSDILATIAKIKKNDPAAVGNASLSTTVGEPEFAFFSAHAPFELTVDAEAIAGGFYRNLSALQGLKNTWWTGAAFHTHSSGPLWEFTEGILKLVLAAVFLLHSSPPIKLNAQNFKQESSCISLISTHPSDHTTHRPVRFPMRESGEAEIGMKVSVVDYVAGKPSGDNAEGCVVCLSRPSNSGNQTALFPQYSSSDGVHSPTLSSEPAATLMVSGLASVLTNNGLPHSPQNWRVKALPELVELSMNDLRRFSPDVMVRASLGYIEEVKNDEPVTRLQWAQWQRQVVSGGLSK